MSNRRPRDGAGTPDYKWGQEQVGPEPDLARSRGGAVEVKPRQPSVRGPAEWFTGDVLIDPIASGVDGSDLNVAAVRFPPGARTAWHAHGRGQTVYVTRARAACRPGARRSSPSAPATWS